MNQNAFINQSFFTTNQSLINELQKISSLKIDVHTMRLKQAIKLLYALVLAISKATCRQDKRISLIKD